MKKNLLRIIILLPYLILSFGTTVNAAPYASIPSDRDVLQTWGSATLPNINPESIKVLVWNIFKASLPGFRHDLKSLAKKHDLVLLQEFVNDDNIAPYWQGFNNFQTDYAVSFVKDDQSTGVATLSKVFPESVEWIRSTPREPITETPKMTVVTTYNVGDRGILCVANLHAINFTTPIVFLEHMRQLEQKIRHHQGPLILAGDFNTWSDQRMAITMALARKLKLKKIDFFTLNPIKLLFPSLDHIFIRGLEVKKGDILDFITSSDHYPRSVELRVLP